MSISPIVSLLTLPLSFDAVCVYKFAQVTLLFEVINVMLCIHF